jgi:hypothetical protein
MKTSPLVLLLCLSATVAFAQSAFPGLKAVLSEAEWKRAGLDRLSPDQLGVIDAALIRHQAALTAQHRTEVAQAVATAPAARANPNPGLMERFGLPLFDDTEWRTLPPLRAKVAKWQGGNRFLLDNGQVWEGYEPITYDILGKEIEIQARPHGQFALVVNGVNTTIRVMRLK